MSIQSIIENALVQDASSVWVLKDHLDFGYSEGTESERYLERVLSNARDLTSRSSELQSHIKDWSSEYHLTVKRAQLLSGFRFDRSLKVLEVGCGCGAITRYLGETFDDVVSVEGSIARARLARLRTRDLPGVSIVCAPFQKIRFSIKFDVIFCVGVYEYSAWFVEEDDPYDAVLRYFSDSLTPNGMVVIAIENQFGLKYFGSSREDHLGVMFEGLEGYHSSLGKVRTFGKSQLEDNLKRHFPIVRFYYPYPDYKLPDCVLAEEFLATGQAGELVSQMKSRDYAGDIDALWDEAPVLLELAKNRMLPFFSNSFLVFAGKAELKGVSFEQLGVLFSSHRQGPFATKTQIVKGENQVIVSKRALGGTGVVDGGAVKLIDVDTIWLNSPSLQTLVYLGCKSKRGELEAIFEPCRNWVDLLHSLATTRGGVTYLEGEHVDSIWSNVYPEPDGYQIVDREWVWADSIRLNVVVIRAIYNFLSKIEGVRGLSSRLDVRSGKALIRTIAKAIGVDLNDRDFEYFVDLEVKLQSVVFGLEEKRHRIFLRWFLLDRASLNLFRKVKRHTAPILSSVRAKISRLA